MIELYNKICKLAENPKLALGDFKGDFINEVFLMLYEVESSKLTEGFIWRTMIRQRFNKNNPIYKKLFKFGDLANELKFDIEDDLC